MPSYSTKGRLPISPVTVKREDCKYVQLLYKGRAAYMPRYGAEEGLLISSYCTKGGLPYANMPSYGIQERQLICPSTAHTRQSICPVK